MLRISEQWHASDLGRQRQGNEDNYFVRAPLFVVADGMGGAQAGEVASGIAVDTLAAGLPDGDAHEHRLAEVVRAANGRIHTLSREDDRRAGMGTTMTVLLAGEDEITIAHVGDSRAYRWRDGRLERLTQDHSLVEEMLRQGRLTPEQAREHPQRSVITRALGPEADVDVDTSTERARDGDVYLVCSDGLTSMVDEARIAEVLAQAPTLEEAGHSLIDAANAAGGRDNITVVLFRLEEVRLAGGEPRAAEQPTQAGLRSEDVRTAVATVGAPTVVSPEGEHRWSGSASESRRLQPVDPEDDPRAQAGAPPPPDRGGRRRRRAWGVAVLLAVVVVPLLLGGYAAMNTVYFLGADDGFVAIYRGLPYELPLGIELYQRNYLSAVPAGEVAEAELLTGHEWRSRSQAYELVTGLERGEDQGAGGR